MSLSQNLRSRQKQNIKSPWRFFPVGRDWPSSFLVLILAQSVSLALISSQIGRGIRVQSNIWSKENLPVWMVCCGLGEVIPVGRQLVTLAIKITKNYCCFDLGPKCNWVLQKSTMVAELSLNISVNEFSLRKIKVSFQDWGIMAATAYFEKKSTSCFQHMRTK